MEEANWIWIMDSIAGAVGETVCCLYILPLVIMKGQSPGKLVYTNLNGRVLCIDFPSASQVLTYFRQSLSIGQNLMKLKGFNADGSVEVFKEDKTEYAMSNSRFVVIQGIREKGTAYHHVIEFSKQAYVSSPYLLYGTSLQIINDINLEKMLLVYSINVIHLIEKSRQRNVNKIEFIYLQDSTGKLWLEKIKSCSLSRLDLHRLSILQSKITINSSKYRKILKKFDRNLLGVTLSAPKFQLKPKMRISKNKISEFMRPSLSESSFNTSVVCSGYYCGKQVTLSRITRSRKASARQFFLISHELIKRVFKYLELPLTEAEFCERFTELYKKIFGSSLLHNPPQAKSRQKEFDKADSVTLCPICFTIFNLASQVENSSKFSLPLLHRKMSSTVSFFEP